MEHCNIVADHEPIFKCAAYGKTSAFFFLADLRLRFLSNLLQMWKKLIIFAP